MTENKSQTQRRRLTPEQKIAILKAHLLDKKPVSDLCDQHGISPTLFYRWQQELFERGKTVFEGQNDKPPVQMERRVSALEQRLARKNEVMAELLTEHIMLKKSLGES